MKRLKPDTPWRPINVTAGMTADQLEAQAKRTPERVAVKDADGELTYAELDLSANRIAHALRQSGRRGPVALLAHHGVSYIEALAGVLKSERIYIPMDASIPPERLRYLINDATAETAIVTNRTIERVSAALPGNVELLNLDALPDNLPDAPPSRSAKPDDIVAIYYTSGSTGIPKGITYSQRILLREVESGVEHYGFYEEDRVALMLSLSFGASVRDMFGALTSGAMLNLLDLKIHSLGDATDFMNRERITVAHWVPSVFRNLTAALADGYVFKHLRLIILGGETVTARDVELFRRHVPAGCLLRFGMGITEACGTFAMMFINRETPVEGTIMPIGWPVDDFEAQLWDENLNKIEGPGTGELVIRSRLLTPGYWRNPEMTAQKFQDCGDGIRLYRTGDLVRRDADGCLAHLGRIDQQIKIRGHRIEAAEVEAALQSLPGVRAAVVAARRDERGGNRLVAYILADTTPPPTVSRLRAGLRQNLADYMLPAQYVFLEELPMTASGKVDRQQLPAPEDARPRLDAECVAPRTQLELRLTRIWEDILGARPVGVKDNFFELGGDSLLAAQFCAEISKEFGRDMPITTLLKTPTVEGLVDILFADSEPGERTTIIPLQTGGAKPPLFAVDTKNAGIFVHLARRLGPGRPIYGLHPLGLSMNGSTTIEALAARYLVDVRKIQPKGPYYICGLCGGALAAFEMAQQLTQSGEEVAFLALFDAFCPAPSLMPLWWIRMVRRVRRKLHPQARDEEREQRKRERQEARQEWGRYLTGMRRDLHLLTKSVARALVQYRPRPYAGKIYLYLAEDTNRDPLLGPRLGWRHLAEVDATIVPGHHHTMLDEPNVAPLADSLRDLLK